MAKYENNSALLAHLDRLAESYDGSTERVDGLVRRPKDVIRTVEFYSNDRYLSGNVDGMGREKPFYNVGNYRVTTAKTATDLDVKDIRFEPDRLEDSVKAMVYNRELYKYLKETNFSKTLNDMGRTRPKYGGLLVKKVEKKGELEIAVVDWVNVDFDPTDIMGNPIKETHWMTASAFSAMDGIWENVSEVLTEHNRKNKNKPAPIEIQEWHGSFPESFYPGEENTDSVLYKDMCFYVAVVGTKKFVVYSSYEKEPVYKYLPWEEVGKSLGKGVWEEGFEAQVWTNDGLITMKNAMELAGKVLLYTDSQKVSGNAITDVDHGHIFQLNKQETIGQLNLQATSMPAFENLIQLWKDQFDRAASTFDANTGEAPPSGTPYSQTVLLNQVANSPFEYQREVWGIFLNEVLNDWVMPFLTKRIKKKHYLVSEFDEKELALIDDSIAEQEAKNALKRKMLETGRTLSFEEYSEAKEAVKSALGQLGEKRELEIPEGWLDVEGRLTANITGELKNKAAILQSLDSVFKSVIATFNPNTGQYGALEDPRLREIFGAIVESSGIPVSWAQLKPTDVKTAPVAAPITSPVTPQTAQA